MSFDIPLHSSIYFHEYHKKSSCFHKTNPNPNPTPELPPRKLTYFHLPWKVVEASMELDVSRWM